MLLAFPSAIQHTRLDSYGGVRPALKRAIELEPLVTGRAVGVTIDQRLGRLLGLPLQVFVVLSHAAHSLTTDWNSPFPILAEAFPQGSMKK